MLTQLQASDELAVVNSKTMQCGFYITSVIVHCEHIHVYILSSAFFRYVIASFITRLYNQTKKGKVSNSIVM